MEALQPILMAILAILIPALVTWVWPKVQKAAGFIKGLPPVVQQVAIVTANYVLALVAGFLAVTVGLVETFGPMDAQALLTAAMGYLTTIAFKGGKKASAGT